MANPSGKNSPSSFDEFSPTIPLGEKGKEAGEAKAAPIPGTGGLALGTPRRATEIALKAAGERSRQTPPEQQAILPPAIQPQAQNDVATIWAEVAQMPGASDLVREYASGA